MRWDPPTPLFVKQPPVVPFSQSRDIGINSNENSNLKKVESKQAVRGDEAMDIIM